MSLEAREAKDKIEMALAATQDIDAVRALDYLYERLLAAESDVGHYRRGFQFQQNQAQGFLRKLMAAQEELKSHV